MEFGSWKMEDAEANVSAAEERQAFATAHFLQRHHKFELFDSVYKAFIDTNTYRGIHFTLSQLLETPHKRFFLFFHRSIPYLARVCPVDGATGAWVNIKLYNEDFACKTRESVPIALHRSSFGDRVSMGGAHNHPYLSSIQSTLYATHRRMRAFYSFRDSRFDIKIYPHDLQDVHVLLTFEPGYPYTDEDAPACDMGESS